MFAKMIRINKASPSFLNLGFNLKYLKWDINLLSHLLNYLIMRSVKAATKYSTKLEKKQTNKSQDDNASDYALPCVICNFVPLLANLKTWLLCSLYYRGPKVSLKCAR